MNQTKKEQITLLLEKKQSGFAFLKKVPHKEKKTSDTWYYLGTVGQIGYAIALPIVGGALLGKYIDEQWITYPIATITGIGFGSLVAILGLIGTVREIIRKK